MKAKLFKLFGKVASPFIGRGLGQVKPLLWAYRIVARNLMGEQDKTVDIHGFKIRCRIEKGRDVDGIAQNLIFKHEYEPCATDAFKKVVKEGMKVVDVGANIGYYSLLAAKLVGKQGYVWAFEPEPVNYAELLGNIALNDLHNVKAERKAVSNYSGKGKLYLSSDESGAHSLIRCRPKNKETVEVQTVMLDDLFNGRVDVLKTDTEGNDLRVLQGAESLLKRNKGIKVFIEVWPDGLVKAGQSAYELWMWLRTLDFWHIYLLDEFTREMSVATIYNVMAYYDRHKFAVNLLCSRDEI